MAEEQNLNIVRESLAAFSRGDLEGSVAAFAEDGEYVEHGTGRTCKGKAQFLEVQRGWHAAFPDASGEVKNAFASGDQVAAEVVWRGTHRGPMPGPAGPIPPTGRSVEVPAAVLWTFRGGKVQRQRQYFDLATLLRQLGVGPS